MPRIYVTVVFSRSSPPAGLELAAQLVRADVLARHHRMRGDRVRFLTTEPVGAVVPRDQLVLSSTDVVDTGHDARHRSGIDRLWRACASDIYRTDDKTCFFRLSAYADRLHTLIDAGELRVRPAACREEVLRVLAAGLVDVPVSGTGGVGTAVPGDPGQVTADWLDAVSSSVTSLGYGIDGPHYQRWWVNSDRRVQVTGSGMLLSHALYWPALLLSAALPLPTDVFVHDELTSTGDPADLTHQYGTGALRWWLLRQRPRAELTVDRAVGRTHHDLTRGLGNLVDRVTAMVHRYRDGQPPAAEPGADAQQLIDVCRTAPDDVHDAVTAFDFRRAAAAAWRLVDEANLYLRQARPWDLARAEQDGDLAAGRQLDAVLTGLLAACRALANQLTPFLPTVGVRIAEQCFALSGSLAPPRPLFPRPRSTSPA